MPLKIIRSDITKMQVDAVVNAANTRLQQGGGVCGAIFSAAGADRLRAECEKIGFCAVGSAVLTGGYDLPAKYIIHTAGPVWQGGGHGEESLLRSCYAQSLRLALKRRCKSVAFPLISSGIFGYSKDKALSAAVSEIGAFVLQYDLTVYLVLFDRDTGLAGGRLFHDIESFIDDNYAERHLHTNRNAALEIFQQQMDMPADGTAAPIVTGAVALHTPREGALPRSLEDVMSGLEETFSQMLLRLIDERGLKDTQVYKKANIDRKLFSKIRSTSDYRPSKMTALALAVALELNLDETKDLLRKAGFALSHSSKFDLIVEYFIAEGNYNIFEINEALFSFDQSLLGA